MGKSYSRTSNLNRGSEEIDGSRRLEIGIVNYDSHGSGSSMSWFEIVTILSFIVTILFVIWECVKYCIHRSFRERMIRREENAHQPPPPYQHSVSRSMPVARNRATTPRSCVGGAHADTRTGPACLD